MVKLLSKQTTNKWYLADQLFDDHREELPVVIVSFQIHDGISDEVIRNLSISGFSWMGDRYFYLTTKNSSRTKSYFCRQFDDTIQNSYSIWSKIGSIRTLRSIPEIGMRLSLLVSSSYPGFTYFDSCDIDVQVIPDIAGTNLASICTDGSGFISSDLVSEHCFPRHVNQGIPLKSVSREIAKNSQSLWSLAYQIRFLCPLGLFKGTLIVDPYLKGKKIILRESMRKILPSPSCNCNIFALSIVNSPPILDCPRFESCYKLPLTVRFVQEKVETISCLVRRCCGCPLPVGSLNRHLILILHERYQIPVSVFSELAK